MQKIKLELVDQESYYRAFDQWLKHSISSFDFKDDERMNELWLKFSDDLGVRLGLTKNEKILAEVVDDVCWREAKKYYSLISFKALPEVCEEYV